MHQGNVIDFDEDLSRAISRILRRKAPNYKLPIRPDCLFRLNDIMIIGELCKYLQEEVERTLRNSNKRGRPRFEWAEYKSEVWVRATEKITLPGMNPTLLRIQQRIASRMLRQTIPPIPRLNLALLHRH